MPDDDEDLMLLPLVNLLSKEAFLTKRLAHGKTRSRVRKQVWDRLGTHRTDAMVRSIVYFRINPDGI